MYPIQLAGATVIIINHAHTWVTNMLIHNGNVLMTQLTHVTVGSGYIIDRQGKFT